MVGITAFCTKLQHKTSALMNKKLRFTAIFRIQLEISSSLLSLVKKTFVGNVASIFNMVFIAML